MHGTASRHAKPRVGAEPLGAQPSGLSNQEYAVAQVKRDGGNSKRRCPSAGRGKKDARDFGEGKRGRDRHNVRELELRNDVLPAGIGEIIERRARDVRSRVFVTRALWAMRAVRLLPG